ncbi:MAG: hypothetical protein Q9225_003480 [Loekoesia sp. 1 TL-2023]
MSQTAILVQSKQTDEPSIKLSQEDISIFHQLKCFRSQVPKHLLLKWETPSGMPTFRYLSSYTGCSMHHADSLPSNIVRDWGIILASTQLYIYYPSTVSFVAAIFFISWGQRGLSNLAHDSVHRNLVAKKKWNDIIADTFLTPAFLTTAKLQREAHTAHHHYLGTAADPDHGLNNETSLKHYREGKVVTNQSIFSVFLYDLFDFQLWYQGAIGSFTSAPFFLTIWWTIVAILTGFLEPSRTTPISIGTTFLFLFHFTRLTLSHIIYVLRETIDHSGLSPSSILDFTRSSPCCNIFQKFLQPHDDNYHLLHHLLPRIPMTRLHEAHLWLVENLEVYRDANTSKYSSENERGFYILACREDANRAFKDLRHTSVARTHSLVKSSSR